MKTSKFFSLIGAVAIAASSSAFALSYNATTDGTTAPAGVTFTGYTGAAVASLGLKSQNGITFLGVQGGKNGRGDNEIDFDQSLKVVFSAPQILTILDLGLLFDGDEYRDFQEIATITAIGSGLTYNLTATGATSAVYTGPGASVANVDPAVVNKGATWKISNPFSTTAIWGFVLSPLNNPWAPKGSDKSDFSLQSFTTRRVPDASSTLALAGLALLGLGAWSRSRR